jgi:hypothetical protein
MMQPNTPRDRADQDLELLAAPDGYDPSRGGRRGLPQIEVVTRSEQEQAPPAPPRSVTSLLLWFLAAFALVLVPASIWSDERQRDEAQDDASQRHLPRGERTLGLGAPPMGALPDASLRQLMGARSMPCGNSGTTMSVN